MFDVERSPELQAALLALKLMNRDLKREIGQEARPGLSALWAQGLAQHATSEQDRRALVPGARVAVGDRRIRAQAATSRKPLSGGLVPNDSPGGLEWGMALQQRDVHGRSPKGTAYTYDRKIGRQFRPRSKKGHVVMRAVGDLGPQIVSGWVQLIVGKLAGAYDVQR